PEEGGRTRGEGGAGAEGRGDLPPSASCNQVDQQERRGELGDGGHREEPTTQRGASLLEADHRRDREQQRRDVKLTELQPEHRRNGGEQQGKQKERQLYVPPADPP